MSYRIADEPKPGPLAQLAVQPIWPLFGFMFGGFWLSLPWFVLNGFAVGCPQRRKELLVALAGLAGAFGLTWTLIWADQRGLVTTSLHVQLGLLVLLVWKIGVCYWLCILQQRSFELYRYYGGIVRNGLFVVIAAYFLDSRLFGALELPLLTRLVLR